MNPLQLVEILKGHKTYIQTHNFPDPDAVASAFGLQCFLNHYDIQAVICYDGGVEKLSTKRMFEEFGIEVVAKDGLKDMTEEDYIIVVDAQKYNANITDFIGDEVACIDHHPTYVACEYQYKDIRDVGACASIITSYFMETETPLPFKAAAALAYGIKMDTADFTRGATAFDAEMFAYAYEKADAKLIRDMYTDVMEFSDLKAYAAAIENIHVYDGTGFAKIPFDCPDALIAIISDFILSLDVVTVSVIYSMRKDGIKFSVRSEIDEVDAGTLTQKALSGYGRGGGHKEMAGGFIPIEKTESFAGKTEYYIEKMFLDAISLGV